MGKDVARDAQCKVTTGNDVARDVNCNITMANNVARVIFIFIYAGT